MKDLASDLKIVFEDDQVLIIDKPAGLVVNRAVTNKEETLQDQVSSYLGLADLGIGDRAGIVHRLDRGTSGLLIVAKTQSAFDFLQKQFKERKVQKEYIALVHGHVKEKLGTVEAAIGRIGKFGKFGVISSTAGVESDSTNRVGLGVNVIHPKGGLALHPRGREARTDFEKISNFKFPISNLENLSASLTKSRINYLKQQAQDYTYLRLFPKTGRTHQIRVHLKSIGHPVVSDLIYAPRKLLKFDLLWCPRLFLHASYLEFLHPKTKKKVAFESVLPKELKRALQHLTIDT